MVVFLAGSLLLTFAEHSLAAEAPGRAGRTLVVASDGSGPYRSVQAAIDAVPAGNKELLTIHIKPGTYRERIALPRDKVRIRLIGEDALKTMLTFDLNARSLGLDNQPIGTMRSTSTVIWASDFVAENLTFANATPRDVAQALAMAANGDRQVFRHCRFLGWQDTLYVGAGRKYFEDCSIEGGVDFIFGPGTAVFKNCEIHSKRQGYVTAASTPREVARGFVFIDCRLTGANDLTPRTVYLGRPWRDYASVTFLHCTMGAHLRPEGWHNWQKPEREKTARYSEYGSIGPGATGERVGWSHQLKEGEAEAITLQAVLKGRDSWDPTSIHPARSVDRQRP
jgi:pectinesterase